MQQSMSGVNKTKKAYCEIMATFSRDLCYVVYLFVSCLIGLVSRSLGFRNHRKYIYAVTGLLQILFFCTYDILHFLIMIGVSIIMIKSQHIHNPRALFVFCFGYRVFFSASKYCGLPRDESNLANALMLVCTLKMIVVAYEVYNLRSHLKNPAMNGVDKELMIEKEPSALDLFCYMTCFAGLFTGPVFKYRTYDDMLSMPYRPIKKEVKGHVYQLMICSVVLLFVGNMINMKYFYDERCLEDPFIVRLWYIVPVGTICIFRYVTVWLIAQIICFMIGLGAYPSTMQSKSGHGPTVITSTTRRSLDLLKSDKAKIDVEYDFKTVANINLNAITEVVYWKTITKWNCTIQWWLAHFVYRSNIFPSDWRAVRIMSTMTMSSLWHGVKPGYWICFYSTPYFGLVEALYRSTIRRRLPSRRALLVYDFIHWFFIKLMTFVNFFIIFTTLDLHRISFFLRATYFAHYWIPLLGLPLCAIALLFPMTKKKVV